MEERAREGERNRQCVKTYEESSLLAHFVVLFTNKITSRFNDLSIIHEGMRKALIYPKKDGRTLTSVKLPICRAIFT